MKGKPIEYQFKTSLKWTEAKKGVLKSEGKPDISVACPLVFGGHDNIWSPEELFLASIEVCNMTTFLWFTKKDNIKFKSYLSNTIGKVRFERGKFRFFSINIYLKIIAESENNKEKIKKILKKVKNSCVVSNSILPQVNIISKIEIN